jgi:hypothetical protein
MSYATISPAAAPQTETHLGFTYEYACPVCGGHAHVGRIPNSSRIRVWCDNCDRAADETAGKPID